MPAHHTLIHQPITPLICQQTALLHISRLHLNTLAHQRSYTSPPHSHTQVHPTLVHQPTTPSYNSPSTLMHQPTTPTYTILLRYHTPVHHSRIWQSRTLDTQPSTPSYINTSRPHTSSHHTLIQQPTRPSHTSPPHRHTPRVLYPITPK